LNVVRRAVRGGRKYALCNIAAIRPGSDCWVWTGPGRPKYGEAWEALNGPLNLPGSREYQPHHVCLNRDCYKPHHLLRVTRSEHKWIHGKGRRGPLRYSQTPLRVGQ